MAGLLAAALTLTACTASPPATGPSETAAAVNTADWPTMEIAGVGPIEKMIDVPEGAVSLRVDFVCLGGYFSLSLSGATQNDRSGGCDGARTFLLPVSERGMMQFYFSLPADSHYALTGEFTTEVFTPDPLITDACAQLSEFIGVYTNADKGYQVGDVSAEEWRVQMDEAEGLVTDLQDTATGLIALQVPALVAGISAPEVVPGYFQESRSPTEMDVAQTIVSAVCTENGTGLAIMATYGG